MTVNAVICGGRAVSPAIGGWKNFSPLFGDGINPEIGRGLDVNSYLFV
jgi:hypothetical protein